MGKEIVFAFFLPILICSVYSQQCNQYTSCKTCLAAEKICSWCESSNTCLYKTSHEECPNLFTFKQQCDESCTGRTAQDCEDCECIWCFDSAQCWSGNLTAPHGLITCSQHRYTCSYAEETIKVLVILVVAVALTAVIGCGLWMVYRKRKGLRAWPFGKRHEYDSI